MRIVIRRLPLVLCLLVFFAGICPLTSDLCSLAFALRTQKVFNASITGASFWMLPPGTTGVSAVLTGGTTFVVDGTAGVSVFDMSKTEFTFLTIQPKNGVSVPAAFQVTTAESSVSWVVKAKVFNERNMEAEAEEIPLIDQTLTSGNSLWAVRVGALDYKYILPRFYSNCTGWAAPEFDFIFSADDQPNRDVPPLVLAEGVFVMPAGDGTGVSRFGVGDVRSVPAGTAIGYMELVSGTSVYYTTNGIAPTAGTGNVLYKGTLLPLSATLARAVQWKGGADAAVMRYRFQTRREEE